MHPRSTRALGAVVILPLAWLGCGEPQLPPANAPSPLASASASTAPGTPSSATATTSSASPSPEWDCSGAFVPPTGWLFHVALRPRSAPNAAAEAQREAEQMMRDKACSGAPDCSFLQSRVTTWKMGSSARDVCAMAVLKVDDARAWEELASSLSTFQKKLDGATAELLAAFPAGTRPKLAVVSVRDGKTDIQGGGRAEWLRTRIEASLGRAADLRRRPTRWPGDGVPVGLDGVVSGEILSRTEAGLPVLEVTFDVLTSKGSVRRSTPVTFRTVLAPEPPFDLPAPQVAKSAGLSVAIDSQRAGSLCVGERTQLWLKSDKRAHVRVFDLYGAGEALVVYPVDAKQKGFVDANSVTPMSDLGFDALPVPGMNAERFLVIAADDEKGLGPYAAIRSECRLPKAIAQALHRGEGIPKGARVAVTGYRLLDGPECPKSAEIEARRKAAERQIAAMAECKL